MLITLLAQLKFWLFPHFYFRYLLFILEVKVEIKKEEPEPVDDQQQDNHKSEHPSEQEDTAQSDQVKVEGEKGGHYSRKRPYEESRSYSYYEHREEKR